MSGFILLILTLTLLAGFFLPGMLYTIIRQVIVAKNFKEFETGISNTLRKHAVSLDQYGCVLLGPFFNDVLFKGKAKYLYGNPDDTISIVTARNLRGIANGKDIEIKFLGKVLIKIVRFFDKGHFKKTLKNPDNN